MVMSTGHTSHLYPAHPPRSACPDQTLTLIPSFIPNPDLALKPDPLRLGGRLLPVLFPADDTCSECWCWGQAARVGVLAQITSYVLCKAERVSAPTSLGCCEDERGSCLGRGWKEAQGRVRLV